MDWTEILQKFSRIEHGTCVLLKALLWWNGSQHRLAFYNDQYSRYKMFNSFLLSPISRHFYFSLYI